MKHVKAIILFCLLVVLAGTGFGQATLQSTTVSAAVGLNDQSIVVASATGFVAPNNGAIASIVFIDQEALGVQSISGTTIGVIRGYGGTRSTAHASGTTTYIGPPNYYVSFPQAGACTAANQVVLPTINITSGLQYNCLGGVWVAINPLPTKLFFPAGTASVTSFNLPTGVAPTTSAVGDWWVPVQVVPSFSEVSGSQISVVGNVYSLAGAQAATTINTLTTITGSSFTINAGLMNIAGKTLEGEAWLTNINTTGTPTVALSVKIGAVTVATCTSAAITNAVTAPVHFTFTVKTAVVGASGTDEAHCALDIPLAAAANAVGRYLDNNTATSSTYDHTVANAIVIQGLSAGASNTITLRDLRYDLKN